MLLVVNCYRPLTRDPASTIEIMREVEQASGIPFTAIVNNSNLGEETTERDVLDSVEYARAVSDLTGLPVKMTSVDGRLYDRLQDQIPNLFPMRLQEKY